MNDENQSQEGTDDNGATGDDGAVFLGGQEGDDAGQQQAGQEGQEGEGEQQSIPEGFIQVPGEDATDEDRAAFREAIGVPTDADGYNVEFPEGYSDDAAAAAKQAGLAAGLTPEQVSILARLDAEGAAQAERERVAAAKQAAAALREEWGPDADRNFALSEQVLSKFGRPGDGKHLKDAGFATDPVVNRLFAKVGEFLGESILQSAESGLDTARNPYHPDSLNLTEQTRLERDNPSLAESLKAAAGKPKNAPY